MGVIKEFCNFWPKYYRETNLRRVANITVSSIFSIKLTQLTFKRLNWQCIYKYELIPLASIFSCGRQGGDTFFAII